MNSIARSDFIASIEAGIAAARRAPVRPFDEAEALALRAVAQNANVVGGNFDEEPGCPLVLAGIYESGLYRSGNGVSAFVDTYDAAVAKFVPNYANYGQFQVVG